MRRLVVCVAPLGAAHVYTFLVGLRGGFVGVPEHATGRRDDPRHTGCDARCRTLPRQLLRVVTATAALLAPEAASTTVEVGGTAYTVRWSSEQQALSILHTNTASASTDDATVSGRAAQPAVWAAAAADAHVPSRAALLPPRPHLVAVQRTACGQRHGGQCAARGGACWCARKRCARARQLCGWWCHVDGLRWRLALFETADGSGHLGIDLSSRVCGHGKPASWSVPCPQHQGAAPSGAWAFSSPTSISSITVCLSL